MKREQQQTRLRRVFIRLTAAKIYYTNLPAKDFDTHAHDMRLLWKLFRDNGYLRAFIERNRMAQKGGTKSTDS
ncbi:unnamed protein product [Dibothriocephalus latus]|uniref:Uncharacterized protein n=1 Tax=Dibothriocephalus latus TaxID=60516 RepID=A0A3P7N3E8_DIBLA|nr:unnamed protein product [Dibothriocephalus latus]